MSLDRLVCVCVCAWRCIYFTADPLFSLIPVGSRDFGVGGYVPGSQKKVCASALRRTLAVPARTVENELGFGGLPRNGF